MKNIHKKIFLIIGTRPEAIKMIPLYKELKKHFHVTLLSTGQHKETIIPIFKFFNVKPDIDLNLLQSSKNLEEISSNGILELSKVFKQHKPDFVLVQGDTITAFIGAFVSMLNKIPIGHVEAGLRTGDITSPFPEEASRQLISRIATMQFCPTKNSVQNLIKENIDKNKIFHTGNTVIDALKDALKILQDKENGFYEKNELDKTKKNVLITCHRRENFGKPLKNIISAIKEIANKYKDIEFIFPVHPNPNVKDYVTNQLRDFDNIFLTSPLDYAELVEVMANSKIILSDSGGIQEEAPSLNVPVIVLRESTERPEGIENGNAFLVGDNKKKILSFFENLINDNNFYGDIIKKNNPYGDGTASIKISQYLRGYFSNE